MGGSSSKSSSSTTNNTNTSNLALDGVEGVVLANATGNTVNVSDQGAINGAFETVSRALQSVDDATASAISSLTDSNTENLDAVTKNTIASLEKINQSNQSEQAALVDKFSSVAIAGVIVFGAVTLWGRK